MEIVAAAENEGFRSQRFCDDSAAFDFLKAKGARFIFKQETHDNETASH